MTISPENSGPIVRSKQQRLTFAILLCGLWLAMMSESIFADDQGIVPAVTIRIDTTDSDVKAVYNLVTKYLNSRPDSLYNNPYWSELEKEKYAEPYSARQWIYPTPGIIVAFPPRILSIERVDEYFCCRILYYAENLPPQFAATNPWALQRLYARIENGSWRLFDPIHINSKSWLRKRVGRVEFIHPQSHAFNRELATKTSDFVDSLILQFECPIDFIVAFYIADNIDDLNALVGLDYTVSVSAGRALVPNHMVWTSMGNEWYPHEVVHVILNSKQQLHPLLSEGIATLIGGTGDKMFFDMVRELQQVWDENDSLSVEDFFEQMYQAGSFTHYYAIGAVLCQAAIDQGGTHALKELLFSGSTDEEFFRVIERVFEIERSELTSFVRDKTRIYSQD